MIENAAADTVLSGIHLDGDRDPPADVPRLCREVRASIEQRGWAHVGRVLSPDEYGAVAASLGHVKRWSDVELRTDLDRAVYKPQAMPFHTDDPDVRYIGWQCLAQDELDGSSQLVDSRTLVAAFSEVELAELAQVRVRYPRRDAEGFGEHPLLEPSSDGWRIYYAQWLLISPTDPDRAHLAERFVGVLHGAIREARTDIRMSPGEALFIDNRRLLHGRGAITVDSKRLLRRVWIAEA